MSISSFASMTGKKELKFLLWLTSKWTKLSYCLCKHDNAGFLVTYNGHEDNVFARIRSHCALNNNKTGAIGFEKYPISNFDLRVRIFHNKLPMNELKDDDRLFIQNLLNKKVGREAVESTWRAFNGWPVLCKR